MNRTSAHLTASRYRMFFLAAMFVIAVPGFSQSNGKTTEQVYKNIQVLKAFPAEQLIPAMQFITASLGVDCDFCHVSGAFEKDDKKPKQTARKMMLMMFAINRDNFDGRQAVTCNSCHRGGQKPVAVPIIAEENSTVQGTSQGPQPSLPSAEQIVDRYVQSVGGPSAVQGINSRVAEGKIEIAGRAFPVNLFYESPDKSSTVIHLSNGDNISTFNGGYGWIVFPDQPTREMQQHELDGARIDGDLHLPLDLQRIFGELHVNGEETIAGHAAYAITASKETRPTAQLYFDKQSSLLLRLVRYWDTPLGRYPVQTDFSDYRESEGLKIPFKWTVARPSARFTIQLERVRQNVSIERSRFAKPAVSASTH